MNKKNGASPRSEVGDRFQYLEAAVVAPASTVRKWETETSSMTVGSVSLRGGGRSARSVSRTVSSNSLLRPSRGPGLDPSALFSVAAMATAPVGTTVIEDEEEEEDSILDAEAIEWMEMKATLNTEDDDLCEHCSRKRQERRRLRQIKKASQVVAAANATATAAGSSCSSTVVPVAAEDRTGLNSESSTSTSLYRRPLSESDTVVDRLTQDPPR